MGKIGSVVTTIKQNAEIEGGTLSSDTGVQAQIRMSIDALESKNVSQNAEYGLNNLPPRGQDMLVGRRPGVRGIVRRNGQDSGLAGLPPMVAPALPIETTVSDIRHTSGTAYG